jgi:DNA-binding transcriptional regulator YbjK
MNAELNVIAQMLIQPELRPRALARKDQFESRVLGEIFDDLKRDRTDEVSVIEKLLRAGELTRPDLFSLIDERKFTDKAGLEALCKAVRDAAHKRANPHSHTMAEAVEAAYNKVREVAKAKGKDIPEFKEVV